MHTYMYMRTTTPLAANSHVKQSLSKSVTCTRMRACWNYLGMLFCHVHVQLGLLKKHLDEDSDLIESLLDTMHATGQSLGQLHKYMYNACTLHVQCLLS